MAVQNGQALRAELASVQEEKNRLRDERAEAKRARDLAKEAFANAKHSGPVTSWPEFRVAEEATRRVNEIDDQLADAQAREQALLGNFSAGTHSGRDESWISDPGVLVQLEAMASSKMPIGRVNLGQSASREAIVDRLGTLAVAGQTNVPSATSRTTRRDGIVPEIMPRATLLDFIPPAPMTEGSSFTYLQEIATDSAAASWFPAAEVAEGEIKPSVTLDYADAEAHVETLAVWSKLLKQQLADIPALEGSVRARLERRVLKRLEYQVLNGDGTGQNIEGLLHTTGVLAPDITAFHNSLDAVLQGIVELMVAGAEPNLVLLNPLDWADALRLRTNEGGANTGTYLSAGAFGVTAERLWGTATLPAAAVPKNKAVTGDFANGMTVLIREGINTLVSDSDSDDFTRNRVTALAEMRAGVAIWSPASFAVLDFTTLSP